MEKLKEWLEEELLRARQTIEENEDTDMNSYGAGYDAGVLDILCDVETFIENLDEEA